MKPLIFKYPELVEIGTEVLRRTNNRGILPTPDVPGVSCTVNSQAIPSTPKSNPYIRCQTNKALQNSYRAPIPTFTVILPRPHYVSPLLLLALPFTSFPFLLTPSSTLFLTSCFSASRSTSSSTSSPRLVPIAQSASPRFAKFPSPLVR